MNRLRGLANFLYAAGGLLAAGVMFGCFVYGFTEIVKGFFIGTKDALRSPGNDGSGLMIATLAGLEMFFLAPLPFLTYRSITKLFLSEIESQPKQTEIDLAYRKVAQVKHLVTGLMIAVVSTELIRRIAAGAELTRISVIAMIGLIVALSIYYWLSGLPKS